MTEAAGTATMSGLSAPPTVVGYTRDYPVTMYVASIEHVYYDPLDILGGSTVSFSMGGHVAGSATATALPTPEYLERGDVFDIDVNQFRPQVGERSLFLLSEVVDGYIQLGFPYFGRLDISGDHVNYYTNPPTRIGFNARTTVNDFLSDLENEIASR